MLGQNHLLTRHMSSLSKFLSDSRFCLALKTSLPTLILHTIIYILYTTYYTIFTVYYILYCIYCILHTKLSILYTTYYTICSRRPVYRGFVPAAPALVQFPASGPLLSSLPPINKAIQKPKNNKNTTYYTVQCISSYGIWLASIA